MGTSDHDYVNFSQDYELDYHLQKVGKRTTQANRAKLRIMGDELKKTTGKTLLKHAEFHAYVKTQAHRLE